VGAAGPRLPAYGEGCLSDVVPALLAEGRPAARGTPEQVLRAEVLSAAYRFEVQVRRSSGRYYLEVHPRAWEQLLGRAAPES
jgi:hypothetical protein